MKALTTSFLLLPLLLASGTTQAQQSPARPNQNAEAAPTASVERTELRGDSVTYVVERYRRERTPILTAEDSARERARRANAEYLRAYATGAVTEKPVPVTVPEPLPVPVEQPLKPTEMIGAEEAAARARAREEQARRMREEMREKKPRGPKDVAPADAADKSKTKDKKATKKK